MHPRPVPSWLFRAVLTCVLVAPSAVRAAERDDPANHGAFRPVAEVQPPHVKNTAWVRNPIDAFIAARHEATGLTPATEASRRTLVRRLFLDLTGLPPSPEEADAFVNDRSPDAFEKLVDRLLASPQHAERYARHWLDLVRWAETEGYESNHPRPYAWRYRDYVVQSFLRDKPYDRFVTEQLAGDELEPYSDENLIATGFLAAARLSSNEEDKFRQRNDVLVDIVNATSSALLGITLHCAQCHNHKLEPFSLSDYYRFQGFFIKGQPLLLTLREPSGWKAYEAAKPPEYDAAVKLRDLLFEGARARLIADAKKQFTPETLAALDVPTEERTAEQERLARQADLKFQFTPGRIENALRPEDKTLYTELKKRIEAMEKQLPDRPQTFGFYAPTSPHRVDVLPVKAFYPLPFVPEERMRSRPHLLRGGEVHERGRAVDPGWPALFGPTPKDDVEKRPRSALAAWLTRRDHPLTGRVWVNRLWQYHFGTGLVATPNDFGLKGSPPSHPELLDWLAGELVRSGWSTRHVNRLIVTSATYRQGARTDRTDPTLLAGWAVRRLEAEAVRDATLAVSGELDRTVGGPSASTDAPRRSLYLHQKREAPPAVQGLFDGPSAMAESCPQRFVTTTPQQALYLLNNTFVAERAKALAERVAERACANRGRQIEAAFVLALGRTPDSAERKAAQKFFRAHGGDGARALTDFCQALLNVNEFVYLE